MRGHAISTVVVLLTLVVGCAAQNVGDYDPDWDPAGPVAGGKADGILDILPVLTLGGDALTGDVGGDRSELYVIDLRRTDRIEVAMTVTEGDLNPHLSFFYGTHSYVGSESWSREGSTLRKVYVAEEAGRYLVAARAYHGEGDGEYSLTATCQGGPCAGEFPPPWSGLRVGEVATCIARARRCSFETLPTYGGAVGEVRAGQIFTRCLGAASLDDGISCASACDWEGDDEDRDWDDARPLCDDITRSLIFYADQSSDCLSLLDSCMSECYSAGEYGYGEGDELYSTIESLCWSDGFNGTCDGFARSHELCGGDIVRDGARECTELCHATTGAHIDDLDTLCSYDSDCEDYCDVEIAQAGAGCGGTGPEQADCLLQWMDDHDAWMCEDAVHDLGT